MTKNTRANLTVTILAGLLAVFLLAPVAGAQTVGPSSFPGTPGDIAFISDRDGGVEIYRMSGDGVRQTRLTDTRGINWEPAWSADGKKIAFGNIDLDASASNFEIYEMNADGSGEKNLTNAATTTEQNPSYSSVSGKLAFTSNRTGDQPDIYLATLEGSGVSSAIRLTTSPHRDSYPALSPDGKRVAFVSDRDGDYDVYVMKAAPESATNRPVKLTKNSVADNEPDWSPDGSQIVFTSDRTGNPDVYRMKASPEGKRNRPVNLTKNSAATEAAPTFSPDGKKVAFSSDRDGDSDIYKMRAADGASQRNLTNNSTFDADPEWQPLP
jgi:Tol biopolymer transport system component